MPGTDLDTVAIRDQLAGAVVAALKTRAKELARPSEAPIRSPDEMPLLVFGLGDALYAVDVAQLVEVAALDIWTPVPSTPAFVLGVVNHRGRILAVIDLRWVLEQQGREGQAGAQRPRALVVVRTSDGMTFGLAADAVTGVVHVNASGLVPMPAGREGQRSPFVRGLTPETASVLDLDALAQGGRIIVNEQIV